jgi:hypothetical protein
MGNVYGTGVPLSTLASHLANFYALQLNPSDGGSRLSSNHINELKSLMSNLTSFSRHVKDVSSEHALFTNLNLREMFSPPMRDHTIELIRFCVSMQSLSLSL